jgi:hypothetical protein
MKNITILLAITIVCAAGFSCKKDEKSKTKGELLTTGSWHVTAYTVDPALDWDGNGSVETNVYAIMDECIKDDHTTFHSDGSGELDEGATKCDDGDPQTVPLTWVFSQNETQLTVQGVKYLIETLTETQLVIKDIETISAVTYTHTVTLSH